MAEAEVGDEQSFRDPTVNALCERVADLLGHEAAVFLPSGTMCNAIAFRLHVRPGGDEVVVDLPAAEEDPFHLLTRLEIRHARIVVKDEAGVPIRGTPSGDVSVICVEA